MEGKGKKAEEREGGIRKKEGEIEREVERVSKGVGDKDKVRKGGRDA